MKIRSDFVTNSSSSSFVVYGMDIKTFKENLDFEKIIAICENNNNYDFSNRTIDDTLKEEILDFIDNDYYFLEDYFSIFINDYEAGIGIDIPTLVEHYPEIKLKDLTTLVAKIFNDLCCTDIKKEDIDYIEICSMDY